MRSLYKGALTTVLLLAVICSFAEGQMVDKMGRPRDAGLTHTFPRLVADNAVFESNIGFGPLSGRPEEMARQYLRSAASRLHMKADLSDLSLVSVQESPAGYHVRFNQKVGDIPVHQADVVVSIGRKNVIGFLSSNYKQIPDVVETEPRVSENEASSIARAALGVSGPLMGEERREARIVVQNGIPRLAYRIVIPSFTPRGDWEVFVDARSGEVFSVIDMTAYEQQPGAGQKKPNFAPLDKYLPVISPRPAIQELVDRVSAGGVTSNIRRLQAFRPRYVGSSAGRDSLAQAREWLIAQMQSYGYSDVVTQNFTYGGNTLQNIIITKTGTRSPDTMVVLGAHYDCVNNAGADDNGSGTSLVLETARILAMKNFEYTIKFIFFSAEEQGLIGSAAYVQNIAVPNGHKIKLMINADMIGYSGGGSLVKVERDEDSSPPGNNAASALYTDTLAALTELYSTLTTQIAVAYASDYMSFEDAGYVITGFFETPENPYYHTTRDSLTYVDTMYVTQIVKAALSGVAHFARILAGSGLAFDPDPLSTAHAAYTDPGYGDNSDGDSPQLNNQRFVRLLPDLTYAGGVYRLEGPYVSIEDWDSPTSAPVTATNPDSFRFTRSQQGFEDVNVYVHLDKSQRYIQSLGFQNIQNNSIHADPHGFGGDDNSAYYPSTNKLTFGEGGVDDAEDADVVLHEYGHAIQHGSVPGWSGSGQQGALGEGFGDYWAESYSRRMNFWLPSEAPYYWVFGWDGHNTFWAGRVLNYTAHYPEGLTGAIHTDGQMWSSTLMSIWNEVGYEVLDRLVLQSHFYLPSSGVTMTQNAQAVIEADRNLYGGSHVQTLVYWFGQRGFINPNDYVPSIVHTPRGDSENPFGPFPVTALVYPGGAALDTTYIKVFWGRGALTDSIDMVRTATPNEWSAEIPGNGLSATYQYYIKVKDVTDAAATSPPGAPSAYHSFYVGDDVTSPTISHIPLRNQPKLRWPPIVRAMVTDNLGVDSVWVEFIRSRGSLAGSFGLVNTSGSMYEAPFALDTSDIQFGDSIGYRIVARDIALVPNISTHPSVGLHAFEIIDTRGLVLVVDDDASTKSEAESREKGPADDRPRTKGATGRLIAQTLADYGFVVDTVSFATHDPLVYPDYDIVVWSGGVKASGVFGDAAKRAALIDRAESGGKIWVEGGEVGYVFRRSTSDLDPLFRQTVLHDSNWISDVTTSSLVVTQPSHPIFSYPNVVSGPVAFTGTSYTARDAMRLLPGDLGTYKIAGWSTYTAQGPDTAGLIVFDNNPNPLSAQIVFFSFALGQITDTTIARNLVENTAEYLMTNEPPPSGGLSGVVSLDGTSDWSGVSVKLQGLSLAYRDSFLTSSSGGYAFGGLYAGSYRVTVSKAGYVSSSASRDTTVGTLVVTDVDFSLNPILPTSVAGTVSLEGESNGAGVTVEILGQGLSAVTDSSGSYFIGSVIPGTISVRASKAGFGADVVDTTIQNGASFTLNFSLSVETVIIAESFEGGTTLPPGWSTAVVTSGSTAPAWTIITGTGTYPSAPPYSGTHQAKFNSYNASDGSKARLTSRRIALPYAGVMCSFYMYHDPGYSTDFDSVTVQATTGDSITGPWTRLGNYIRYSTSQGWRKDSVDLTAFAGSPKVYVSFLGTSSYGNNIYIDEVSLYSFSVDGSISGLLFEDMDGDSLRDDSEPLLSGWKVRLSGLAVDSVTTDSTGGYYFGGLSPGNYVISETASSGWDQLYPAASHAISLGPAQHQVGKDFANYRFVTLAGKVANDVNGDSSVTGDAGLLGWKVHLSGVRTDSTVTDSAGLFTFTGLPPGSYDIDEVIPVGWVKTSPGSTGHMVAAQSGASIGGFDFGNFELGSVSGFVWKDLDADGVKDEGEPALEHWTVNLVGSETGHQSVVSDAGGGFAFDALFHDTYTLTEELQSGYALTSPPGGSFIIPLRSGLDSSGLGFGNFYPDTAFHRTFSADSIAWARDAKGKVGKPNKRKPDKVDFEFALVVPEGSSMLTTEFSMVASGAMLHSNDTLALFSGKKPGPLTLSVSVGETVVVRGQGNKGRLMKAKYAWGTNKKAVVGSFVRNIPRLPMPNAVNLLEDLFARSAFASTQGLRVGRSLTGIDAKRFGWVQIAKYKDVVKSMYSKGMVHVGPPRFFDYLGSKAFVGLQKSLPATKHDNRLFAQLLTLKVNIIASAAGMTPPGFGELIYDDGSGSPLCGLPVAEIADSMDSYATYGLAPPGMSADSLEVVLRRLNTSFEGVMDTLSFGSGLVCNGVKPLSQVAYLKPNLSAKPVRIELSDADPGLDPSVFALSQNYPNPFNPITTIEFSLPEDALLSLKVYDVLGREVRSLVDREMYDEGDYSIDFVASEISSGIYFYRLVAEVPEDEFEGTAATTYTQVRKFVLLK